MLQNFGTALSRDEMRNVVGGLYDEDGGGYCGGMCYGSVGAWDYAGGRKVSLNACLQDVQRYCPSGNGYCTYCTI